MWNNLREYREKAGMTQVELARRSRIASTNISNFERGVWVPWDKAKRRLARALKTTEDMLFPEGGGNGKR